MKNKLRINNFLIFVFIVINIFNILFIVINIYMGNFVSLETVNYFASFLFYFSLLVYLKRKYILFSIILTLSFFIFLISHDYHKENILLDIDFLYYCALFLFVLFFNLKKIFRKAIYFYALRIYESEKYQKAVSLFTFTLKYCYNKDTILFYRGHSHFKLNEFKNALKDYSESIKINPKEPNIYYNRAIVYEEIGEYKKAFQDFKTNVKLNSKDSKPYVGIALYYLNNNEIGNAKKYFKLAIELDEDNKEYLPDDLKEEFNNN